MERAMRRGGTLAAESACAVRSTMRSWKEKRQALRGPRLGVTKPACTSMRMVLRGSRRSCCTSRTPYGCTGLFLGGRLARGLGRRRLGRSGALRGLFLEARAQRLHEIDHLARRLRRFGKGNFLAF